jgi:hypothetical protein
MTMPELLHIGPDGLLLVEAMMVSAIVALLAWRRVSLSQASTVTAVVALALVLVQAWYYARHPDEASSLTLSHQLVVAMFTIVPSALRVAASRLRWLTRHAWVLLVAGPIVFVGCFVGICELCARARLI